jgi:hypothetical protein
VSGVVHHSKKPPMQTANLFAEQRRNCAANPRVEHLKAALALASSSLLNDSDDHLKIVDALARTLAEVYDHARQDGWLHKFRRVCQSHPIHELILQDPYSRRAFEKPRGYAGDAVMLDYIYRPRHLGISNIGQRIHEATTGLSNAKSIVWRRDHLASKICETLKRKQRPKVLSVASGHLRELDTVRVISARRDVEIWALDQDPESLKECRTSYPDFTIHPINRSISFLFKESSFSQHFDLIYSAGLFDYLGDRTAEALIRRLYSLLSKIGCFIVGNFAPDSHGRGFMDAFMDWSLVYRSEEELIQIFEKAVPSAKYRVLRDTPGNVAYIESSRIISEGLCDGSSGSK